MEVRTSETISIADIQSRTDEIFDRIERGEQDKYVVLKDNEIAAVLLPADRYQALLDELEDLRIDAIAAERTSSFDPSTAIPLDALLAKYDVPREGSH
ncbi:MAG: type II toxin-antitoxin system Phd/YefM family antitoxin [Pseudomonadota bacterium]